MILNVTFSESSKVLDNITFSESSQVLGADFGEVQIVTEYIGDGVRFTTDETLTLDENNVLSVNVADEVEVDNTLPVSSAAVASTVGNIEILLQTI